MASVRRAYAVPSIASFSESELMDRLGSATQYPGLDAAPSADPSDPGGTTSAGSKPKGKSSK